MSFLPFFILYYYFIIFFHLIQNSIRIFLLNFLIVFVVYCHLTRNSSAELTSFNKYECFAFIKTSCNMKSIIYWNINFPVWLDESHLALPKSQLEDHFILNLKFPRKNAKPYLNLWPCYQLFTLSFLRFCLHYSLALSFALKIIKTNWINTCKI